MKFEYYVLNYDIDKNKVIPYNIFRNINVQECTEREVKKYIRSPKNYMVLMHLSKKLTTLLNGRSGHAAVMRWVCAINLKLIVKILNIWTAMNKHI